MVRTKTSGQLVGARVGLPANTESGAALDLGAMLKGIEGSALQDLRTAIAKKDGDAFNSAYRSMLDACHGCHVAAEKPYLRPHIPEAPASRMIDFTPR